MDGPLYSEFGGSDPLHVVQLWFSRLSIDNRCNATITLLTPCATLVKLPKVPETCLFEHETSLEILTFPVRHGGPHDDSSRAGCDPRAGRCAPLEYRLDASRKCEGRSFQMLGPVAFIEKLRIFVREKVTL